MKWGKFEEIEKLTKKLKENHKPTNNRRETFLPSAQRYVYPRNKFKKLPGPWLCFKFATLAFIFAKILFKKEGANSLSPSANISVAELKKKLSNLKTLYPNSNLIRKKFLTAKRWRNWSNRLELVKSPLWKYLPIVTQPHRLHWSGIPQFCCTGFFPFGKPSPPPSLLACILQHKMRHFTSYFESILQTNHRLAALFLITWIVMGQREIAAFDILGELRR